MTIELLYFFYLNNVLIYGFTIKIYLCNFKDPFFLIQMLSPRKRQYRIFFVVTILKQES